jgi:hypothetical protein
MLEALTLLARHEDSADPVYSGKGMPAYRSDP